MSDYFYKVGRPGSATTMAAPGYTTGATTITVGSTANWPTDTKVAFAIDRAEIVAGEEVQIAGTYTEWTGQVTGATTIGSMVLSSDSPNSDQNYAAGSLTRVYIPVSATRENNLIDGILEHANQDGTLITQAVRDALSLGVGTSTGWEVGSLPDVSTVTANGNRSYDVTFASAVDSILSEGMRLRTTRTSAASVTCFSLDGSNDYFNKTSPAGMTFTDDFVVSAWVYLTSYGTTGADIASRYNGTSGWILRIGALGSADGRVQLVGLNAGGVNYSAVISYQSVPLNKWVHITAQLDMSAFTATTTTSYVMFNGKDVPAYVSRGGTNPTALVQAGNLEIGSENGGAATNIFPGQLKDICIYGAKVTQADILSRMSQAPTGSETNLISAYSGANTTDLNTTNANNLTAQNGAVSGYANAPYGNRGVSTTLDYGLVMSVSGSTAVVQVPEGCTIPTTGGITSVAYSTQANPYGWVSDKGRWYLTTFHNYSLTQGTPTAGTYYNISGNQLAVPVGSWTIGATGQVGIAESGGTLIGATVVLSKSASTADDQLLTSGMSLNAAAGAAANINLATQFSFDSDIRTTTVTPYYMNVTTSSLTAPIVSVDLSLPRIKAFPSGL